MIGCFQRNLRAIVLITTVLAFFLIILSAGKSDYTHKVVGGLVNRPPTGAGGSQSAAPSDSPTAVSGQLEKSTQEAKPKEKKERGNILVILPKDQRTGGDFGFKQGGWLEAAISNRQEYADAHGYKFIWEDLSKFKPEYDVDACWAKIAALQHAFDNYPDCEWFWMLDSDAIIMNGTVDLWEHLLSDEALRKNIRPNAEIKVPGGAKIKEEEKTVYTPAEVNPDEIYLIIATDGNGINAGSFFIRRNPFMSALIDFWKDPYLMNAGFGYREQDALAHLMVTHSTVVKHTGIVDQRLINEYVDRIKPGDFVVHFAGCIFYKERDCDALFLESWNKRIKAKPQP